MPTLHSDQINFYEISPSGLISPKLGASLRTSTLAKQESPEPWARPSTKRWILWHKLRWLDRRQQHLFLWDLRSDEETRSYSIPLVEVFHRAAAEVPSISVDIDTMAGAPCITGTRIPVYGVLDALEDHGSIEGVQKSYPRLTVQQIKDAILYAKLVVECPLEE